ncbi:MAG: PAS domain S-box protein [Nitrolancea sp.]
MTVKCSAPDSHESGQNTADIASQTAQIVRVPDEQGGTATGAEQQYHDIFDAASDGLVVNDLETGIVLEANPAFCRMHGYDDMTGLHPSVFIHPDSHYLFADYVAALHEGRQYRCRALDVRRDGTVFDVEVLGRLISYHGQEAMLGVVRDVSEEVRAYQILEERVAERTSEIQRRQRVAEGMRELIEIVNSRQSPDEILNYLVGQAKALLESNAVAIFLPLEGRETELLGIRASTGLPGGHPYVRMPLGVSSTGLAYTERTSVLVKDLKAALPPPNTIIDELQLERHESHIVVVGLPSFLENPERAPGADDTSSMTAFASLYGAFLSVPLIAQGDSFGTLSLYYHDPRDFSEDDISLANAFASQAALALENARLREQAGLAAALEERQRLARELHDAVTQTLFSASLISEVIPDLWETDQTAARRRLEQLRQLNRSALAEMRILLLELRPSALTDIPFPDLIRQLVEASTGATTAQIELKLDVGKHQRLMPDAQIALYRIAQEALNNVVKHAQAKLVEVFLACDPHGGVCLTIRDDGLGFDPAAIRAGHLGVGFMGERAAAIGADIRVESAIGAGTTIHVRWNATREVPG